MNGNQNINSAMKLFDYDIHHLTLLSETAEDYRHFSSVRLDKYMQAVIWFLGTLNLALI